MNQTTLEQVIEAASTLPAEDLWRLRQWLEQKERETVEAENRQAGLKKEIEDFRKAMRWIEENRSTYLGQWVALEGDVLISHGVNARQVYEEARAAGVASPFLERIVEKEQQPYWAGW